MALSKDIVIRLLADTQQADRALKANAEAVGVTAAAYRRAEREFDKQQKAMEAASRKQRAAMEEVGTAAGGFGLAMAAGLGLAAKAAMDWESSWAGVTKTVSGTDAELAEVEKGLRDLTSVLPASHTEIAAVAEAAGQLGVQTPSIVEFTRTMVNLGETTNLTSEEAATSLAQLMNVMRTSPDDVGRLGASLVALGNAGASTEADILKMASYLSGAASLIGASESDVLAMSNALTSMGVNAERGGGVMTRVMQDIYSAVQMGGDELEGFALVAGMSSAEFARAFEADPIRAIAAFTDGLGKAKGSGENVVAMLNDLGYKGTQDTAVLLQLASAQGEVTKNLDLGNTAWEQNTALVEEAAKRYDTTAAKLEIARNGITEAGIEIGEALLPVLADVAGAVADVAQWFADLPGPVKDALAVLGTVGAVGGMAAGAFLLLAPRVADTFRAFRDLQGTMPGVSSGLSNVGKAAGVAGAIIAVAQAADALAESFGKPVASMEATTAALLDMDSSMKSVDALFKASGGDVFADDINGVADAASRLADPGLVSRFDDFTAEVLSLGSAEGRNEREQIIEQFGQIGTSLALLVENGNAELAAEQFDLLAEQAAKGGLSVDQFRELLPSYTEALKAAENEQKLAAESATGLSSAVATVAPTVESTYGSLAGYAAALGLDEDATQELIKKTEELGTTLADFINPLGLYTTMLGEKAAAEQEAARKAAESAGASAESWREFVVDTGFSFDEYMARLREQVEAQTNWRTNMLALAGQVSEGTLAELARMGPEGAPLVADLVNRSDAELAEFDDIMGARAKEGADAWGAQLTMAQPVLAEIAGKAGRGAAEAAARELQAGTSTLAQIAADYGIVIAGGLNPILNSLGKASISIGRGNRGSEFYSGGYTGPGGKYDPAGIVHAGEYVLTKEETSRLGIQRIEEFANRGYATGGFVTPADVPRPRSTAPARPPISSPADASMERMRAEAVAFVAAQLAAAATQSGPLGSGSVGGGWQGLWRIIRSNFPEARLNSSYRPGDPGYHGRGRAVDLGWMRAPGGIGNAYMASMNRWIHDRYGANTAELIYDGLGDDRPDLKNGRPLTYNAATRAQHRNHVHWAMANGGVIGEPVVGFGLHSGGSYSFGERGPETVLPGVQVGAAAGGSNSGPVTVNLSGAQITGRLALEADGFVRLIDGRITTRNADLDRNARSAY